jgi:hypothetical protein
VEANSAIGVAARCSAANPIASGQSGLVAVINRITGNALLYAIQNGAWGTPLIDTSISYVANLPLEIDATSASAVKLYYNGVQVGTDQDVSSISLTGTYAGVFYLGETGDGFSNISISS